MVQDIEVSGTNSWAIFKKKTLNSFVNMIVEYFMFIFSKKKVEGTTCEVGCFELYSDFFNVVVIRN